MPMHRRRLLAALPALAGCAAPPIAPMVETYAAAGGDIDLAATILAIEPGRRELVLRATDGARLTVRVSSEVRNFAQLRDGDRVLVRYQEAFAASLVQPGSGPAVDAAALVAARAAPGARPAGAVGELVRARVNVLAVDQLRNTVTFAGPNGVARTVQVREASMQALLRTLRPGMQLDVSYEEALAVAVEPAGR